MSNRWHYRFQGRDIGPVDFATLRLMAKEDRLSIDQEVRDDSSPEWVSAGSVAGLFPESADADDLTAMLSDGDIPARQEDRTDFEDACYCRTRTEELGPMRFEKLVALARNGRIARRDQVRIGARGQWVEARSVAGLFEEPVKPASQHDDATAEVAALLDTMEIVADPTPVKQRAPLKAPQPAARLVDEGLDTQAAVDVPDAQAQWYCRLLGQEIGPIPWNDLRELVDTKQLGPNDRVRKGQAVAWVPASNVENLFTKRKKTRLAKKKLSDEDVLDILQPEEPEESETPSYAAHQRSFTKPGKQSTPSVPTRPTRKSDPDVEPRPTPVAPRPAVQAPVAAPATPPAPRPLPAPPRQKRSFQNPLSGLGSRLSGMGSGLSSLGKPAAAVAVLAVIVGIVIFAGPSLTSFGQSPNQEIYNATAEMWSKAQSFRKADSEEAWKPFSARYQKRLLLYATPLAENAGDPLSDVLAECYRDYLPKILSNPVNEADEEWAKMEEAMKKADALAK
jgi:hypothetical protein